MTVPRHYIKLLPRLRDYALQVSPHIGDWQQAVFDDITEKGTKLTIERLPPTEHGLRIGLCGDKYYCEATRDRDRNDTIFVFKVDSAARRELKSVPDKYPGEFLLAASKATIGLDPATDLWSACERGTRDGSYALAKSSSLDSVPSDQLAKLLCHMPSDVRALWRPVNPGSVSPLTEGFLDAWRTLWVRFQLDRFKKLTPNQASFVKSLVPAAKLTSGDKRDLMAVLSVGLLNAYARDALARTEVLQELLRAVANFSLSSSTRASVWTCMVQGLDKDEFLRELYDAASTFKELRDPEESTIWSGHLLALLSSMASRFRDPLLEQLAEDCRGEEDPLAFLGSWAVKNLEFEDTRTRKVKPAPLQQTVIPEAVAPQCSATVEQMSEDPTIEPVAATSNNLRSKQFGQWLLRLQGIDPLETKKLTDEACDALFRAATLASDCACIERLSELATSLSTLEHDVRGWLSRLPDPLRLTHDFSEGANAYDRAFAIMGNEIDSLLAENVFTPQDIVEAVGLLARVDILRALPTWIWQQRPSREPALEAASQSIQALFRHLLVPPQRERIISMLSCVGETGSYDLSLLPVLPCPTSIADLDENLGMVDEHVRNWLKAMRELLAELPEGLLSQLGDLPKSSTLESQTRQAVGTFRNISGRVPDSVAKQIICSLLMAADERQCIRLAELYLEGVSFWEKHFGTGSALAYDQLQLWVEKRMTQLPIRDGIVFRGSELRIEHNWIDAKGGKVPLLYKSNTDQTVRPYGYVSAPLVLINRQKSTCVCKVSYEVRTGHRDGWPKQWENPEPTELGIDAEAWRDDPDQPDQYLYTFKVRLPIRREGRGERFEFQVGLTDSKTGSSIIGAPRIFSWDFISDMPRDRFVPTWPETVDPSNVEKHPIGPQKRSREILKRLQQDGSFCVTAPRRFGKSTLVEFLRAKAQELGFSVPPPVVCTNHYVTAQGLDYEKMWQVLSDNLQIELGSSITRPGVAGVPSEQAFDHLRRAAQNQGKKGIVILFDEAQLFFPAKAGVSLGDVIKDRLERHWSTSRPDMAPVMFGFIGLPTLNERAGANLIGLLRPLAHNDLEEDELNSVILSVTSNALRTTREARRRLARTAANFYILRTLVTHLAEHVQDDGRLWASFDDVIEVETAMRSKLRDAQEPVVSSYIRDILNDAEDVNQWKPNSALLLAMAIADVKHKGVASVRIYDEAGTRLNTWYNSIAGNDMTRLSYDDQQFREHLRTLEERGVLKNREFTSPLLGDWLLGFTKQASDHEWKALLQSAAIKRIRIPVSMQKVIDVDGSEATVWTTSKDQVKYAYRITRLHTDDDRIRFTETREILENLKVAVRDGDAGSQYIFRLSEIGLSEENDAEAVQVYRWVDGADLSRRCEQFPATYVADLGIKLSTALHFLHNMNIIHRDLSPRNIIVADEGGDPVIIDFGFARRLTPEVKSSFDSDYSAPEVRRVSAKWTKAADVYSLGATLWSVLDPRDPCPLVRAIIQRCMEEDPDSRPDAARLVRAFDDAIKELHVDTRQKEVWDRIQRICGKDYQRLSWFRGLVDKFRGIFGSIGLGCFSAQFDRCREAANFLNQVLEASSSRSPERLTLGKVKDDNPQTGDALATDAIRFMHSIRRYHSHGEYGGKERATAKFGPQSDTQMLSIALEAGAQISTQLNVPSITDLTRFLLQDHSVDAVDQLGAVS